MHVIVNVSVWEGCWFRHADVVLACAIVTVILWYNIGNAMQCSRTSFCTGQELLQNLAHSVCNCNERVVSLILWT